MIVSSIQYSINNRPQYKSQPTFSGKKVDLDYIMKNRSHLLPERVLEKVNGLLASKQIMMPTLKEVHHSTYSGLMDCKTLEEAQRLFPEFAGMKEAPGAFVRGTGNIKKLLKSGVLNDNFSLKMLQEIWVNLKSQDEIAKELGLKGRTSLTWVLQKIGFVGYQSNYKTLLMASDPQSRAVIAAKTTAWNAAHPDLMRAKNKHAAQSCKTEAYRKAQSKRMKAYDEANPERKQKIGIKSKEYWADPEHRAQHSARGLEYDRLHPERRQRQIEYSREVWSKIPEVRMQLSNFFKDYVAEDKVLGARLRHVFEKNRKGLPLTGYERMILGRYQKACNEAIPELREQLSKAYKLVKEEHLAGK